MFLVKAQQRIGVTHPNVASYFEFARNTTVQHSTYYSTPTMSTTEHSVTDIQTDDGIMPRTDYTTPCPRKKQATLIFDITSPSVEIFSQFLKHLVQD